MKKNTLGFTLIELMIVVAIISILAGIAIPQFANLVAKSQEADTKGNLGVLRSALAIYYGDNEGNYLTSGVLSNLTVGQRYLASEPTAYLPTTPNNVGHPSRTNGFNIACPGQAMIPCYLGMAESPGWVYDKSNGDPDWGMIIVGCTHQDLKGQPWYDN